MPHKIALKTWAPALQRTVEETLRCIRARGVAEGRHAGADQSIAGLDVILTRVALDPAQLRPCLPCNVAAKVELQIEAGHEGVFHWWRHWIARGRGVPRS